ncbi:AAA family ATPase [Pseudomonas sp. nanlin1]|uniref:AAA family ATPase n=1 Tax=Pseudomonas sp. nanlin1 TaxID=3040605 RepID=UPI00388F8D03
MKILAIRLKNLASLAGPFELDFTAEPLASAGLFAITGPTGAGKSTLLDALCLALFGAVPRLSKASQSAKVPDADGEIGSYDARTLLRRGTGSGYAEVDFVGVDGRRYRARWEANRARDKAAGKLQSSRQSLRDLDNDQLLASQKNEYKAALEARLGLNFEQFTRAVLLAQSEFSAFLKADDNERSELLEKLTDTALYTRLGKQAFDKARQARERLRQLQEQSGNVAPLATEERQALEEQFAEAQLQLKNSQLQLRELERQQQWHVQAASLAEAVHAARSEGQQAGQAWQALSTEQQTLQQLEQLAPQRHLFSQQAELRSQLQPLAAQITGQQAQHQQLEAEQRRLHTQVEHASQALQGALSEQADSADLLRQAFDEHSHLGRLAEQLLPLQNSLEAAEQADQQAQQALQQLSEQHTQGEQARQALVQALTRSEHLQALDEAWTAHRPRLQQSVLVSNRLSQGQAEWPALEQRLAQANAQVDALRNQLNEAHRHADCPPAALPERLHELTQRLHSHRQQQRALESLQRHWQQRQQGEQQKLALAQRHQDLSSQLQQRTDAGLRLKAEHDQARQALDVTLKVLERQRLARGATVEQLRASLQPEQPCPVCGSQEHPYQHAEVLLQALAGDDEQAAAEARQHVEQLAEQLGQLREVFSALREQLKAVTQQQAQLQAEQQDTHLHDHPLYAQLQAQAEPDQWLHDELARLAQALAEDEGQQQRLLDLQRQAGQLQQQLQLAEPEYQAASQVLDKQRSQLQHDRERLDEDLQAFASLLPSALLDGLREQPGATFMALDQAMGERASLLDDLHEQGQALEQRQRQIEQQRHVSVARAQALEAARQRHAELASQHQAVALSLGQRLGEYPDPTSWQRAQQQRIDTARSEQADAQQALQNVHTQALQLAAELHSSSAQSSSLQQALAQVDTRIQAWRERQPQVSDEALNSLLAYTEEQVAALRQRLQAAQKAIEQAQVRLQEREQRQASHQADANGVLDADALQTAHATLQSTCAAAEQRCAELRAQQAEDQRRVLASQALLASISLAEADYRRWARLSDLIGSADGAQFRRLAQAYNLDLLVHHANVQLRQLVKRYRLKRGGSTLGLLVLDTEMGDELRSVHSLSGGETFLVSLALALGLASMASSTLRIESLFIDEGFGSLDPESLQLAMDALDGLQAQGRKVAVISHVQEMHERIPVQIQVRRQGNGLSTVEVCG